MVSSILSIIALELDADGASAANFATFDAIASGHLTVFLSLCLHGNLYGHFSFMPLPMDT